MTLAHQRLAPERIPPVLLPVERCCYCWYVLHPTIPYPAAWSSTICDAHTGWILAQHTLIRARRVAQQRTEGVR